MLSVSFKLLWQTVYVVFYQGRRRVRLSLGIIIPEKMWQDDFVSPNHPDYSEIRKKLLHYDQVARASIKSVMENKEVTPSLEEVKKTFHMLMKKNQIQEYADLNVRVGFTMIKDFEKFMEVRERQRMVKPSTLKKYKTVLNILLEFETHYGIRLDVDIFDKVMYEQMISFMLFQKDLLNNTVAKHVSVMRTFYGDTYPDADRSFFSYSQYKPEIIALEEAELMQLIGTPFEGAKEIAKDMFVFMCLTGMRVSDVQRFTTAWIRDRLIVYSAHKNMSRAYVPVTETVQGILEKYNGEPPQLSEQYFNRTIKKVLQDCGMIRPIIKRHRQGKYEREEIMPLWEAVSSHTGRKTFISIMLERGVPIQDVMNMSGHQDYRSMKPYIMVSRTHMRKYRDKLGL